MNNAYIMRLILQKKRYLMSIQQYIDRLILEINAFLM